MGKLEAIYDDFKLIAGFLHPTFFMVEAAGSKVNDFDLGHGWML